MTDINGNLPNLTEFVNTLYQPEDGEVICLARPAPDKSGVFYQSAWSEPLGASIEDSPDEWYICVSTVKTPEKNESVRRRKVDCTAVWVLMLDDIGTKATAPPIEPSVVLETSEGNYQWLFLLEPFDVTDADALVHFEACNRAIVSAGYGDKGAGGVSRVFRIPGSINKKKGRGNWPTRVIEWHPGRIYGLNAIMSELDLKPEHKSHRKAMTYNGALPDIEDPVLAWLAATSRLGSESEEWFDIKCPWAHEHESGTDIAGYSPLRHGSQPGIRGFHCFHEHCDHRHATQFLEWVEEHGGPRGDVDGRKEFDRLALKAAAEEGELTGSQRIKLMRTSFPTLRRGDLPNVEYNAPKKDGTFTPAKAQPATGLNIEYIMDRLGVVPRYDLISRDIGFNFIDPEVARIYPEGAYETGEECMRAVKDECETLGIKLAALIKDAIVRAAERAQFHPMEERIKATQWDGVNRLDALTATVQVKPEYAEIWPIYLRRWLIQFVQGVCGWRNPKQISSVLVLSGPQGCGKTTWFEKLVPKDYFLGGAVMDLKGGGTSARDTVEKNTSVPLVELGELETTFQRAAAGALKSHLSLTRDVYRQSYGLKPRSYPRTTVYSATMNMLGVFVDVTGSRRFWPAEILHTDELRGCDAFSGIDMDQVWAEVYQLWLAGESWELLPREEKIRDEQSETFLSRTDAQEKAEHWFSTHEGNEEPMNRAMFCEKLGIQGSNNNMTMLEALLTEQNGTGPKQIKHVRNAWMIPTGSKAFLSLAPKTTAQQPDNTTKKRRSVVDFGKKDK